MARDLPPYVQLVVVEEEDCIDMDSSCSSNEPKYSSPPRPTRDFEFQVPCNPQEKEPLTSPADELFYRGILLPLHLPPRLQMVEKLLRNHTPPPNNKEDEAPTTATAADAAAATPLGSPEDYLFGCPMAVIVESHQEKKYSWAMKLKLIRGQSSLGPRMNASRAYLKFLFAIERRHCPCKDSSSTSSMNSDQMQMLKGSSSGVNSEVESSIQAAITHCKKSQQQQQVVCGRIGTRKYLE